MLEQHTMLRCDRDVIKIPSHENIFWQFNFLMCVQVFVFFIKTFLRLFCLLSSNFFISTMKTFHKSLHCQLRKLSPCSRYVVRKFLCNATYYSYHSRESCCDHQQLHSYKMVNQLLIFSREFSQRENWSLLCVYVARVYLASMAKVPTPNVAICVNLP